MPELKHLSDLKFMTNRAKRLSKRIVSFFFQLLKETLINLWASKSWQIVLKYLPATENLLKQ